MFWRRLLESDPAAGVSDACPVTKERQEELGHRFQDLNEAMLCEHRNMNISGITLLQICVVFLTEYCCFSLRLRSNL
jgi:hypothetical protein